MAKLKDSKLANSERLRDIAMALVADMPDGWTEARCSASYFDGPVLNSRLEVTMKDGNIDRGLFVPDKFEEDLLQLRKEMIEEGLGAWFSVSVNVKSGGHFDFDFGYEPVINPYAD